ncbi:histidinol-phosphatase [Amycolatopsis bartoniae]|uniref:Histidinol-phosphatase n=1 Tax=Amycolatopsis bartoniae TaxID=941986 RepID=A0A8H9MDC2_9PSEU|nr:histidinol-phosphatase [Amycolatopsis bartoniae]MBB2937322.1 histidinol-phosphatase [Amycolatopsis bartoniae]TVT07958.1 histidinol-phosphatase [Amycolatopsis bartoniae]GHF78157.1 histidinol-phosphatase [Amycolatopsis bartoniae]
MASYSDDLTLAGRLADAADAITTARFRARDLRVASKPDRTPVTDADTAVEDAVRELLAAERPSDAVAGEERGGTAWSSGRAWVLDPIDGTKNFLRGAPVWATLIALVEDGTPVVGMVSAPLLGRRWWASLGEGAWLRDAAGERRISVSGVSALSDAYLSTTHLNSWSEHHSREAYLTLNDACWETRAFGDFWQHCLVAEGAIDLAAEAIVNPWDVAPMQVLVTEAGGRFSDLGGEVRFDGGSALSSNGHLHDEALGILQGS